MELIKYEKVVKGVVFGLVGLAAAMIVGGILAF